MREILFRGKYIRTGEWVCGYVYISSATDYRKTTYYIRSEITLINEKYNTNQIQDVEVYEKTVGQFTGLYDKNGNKIFEGDIVHVILENNKPKRDFISYVIWSDTCCEFRLNDYDYFMDSNTYGMEVIGNIHDNPELLKGE